MRTPKLQVCFSWDDLDLLITVEANREEVEILSVAGDGFALNADDAERIKEEIEASPEGLSDLHDKALEQLADTEEDARSDAADHAYDAAKDARFER